MHRFLREPLVHFLLIGAALFAAWHFLQPPRGEGPEAQQIRFSPEEISQLALVFQSQWNRAPTVAELEHLVENRVQEEVLYREGLAMGLDKGDTIVKRRLAQKMQFLAEDVGSAREPAAGELRDWYAKNTSGFAQPVRYSFRHLYFSPDRRGPKAREDAARALAQLAGQPEDTKLAGSLADPFMFQDYYRDRTADFLAKEFGPNFAQAMVKLPPGAWQGPVESGLGWHLVFVDTVVPGREPDFEEVAGDVKTAWLAEQKAQAWTNAYKALRDKYTVFLPAPPEESAAPPGAAPAMAPR